MSDNGIEGESASNPFLDLVKSPSQTLGTLVFSLGVWGLILGIVNVLCGAVVAGERKVVWAGWLTMGYLWDEPYSEMIYRPYSDTVFLGMATIGTLYGAWALHQKVEGGFVAWLKGVFLNPGWTSLVSTKEEGGLNMTLASWLILIGFSFYGYWAIVHWAWVDIGVYAVTAPLLAFGFGLRYLALVEDENDAAEL